MVSPDIPQSFLCPLTLQIMKDPVMDGEGNSYEREAIEKWLDCKSHSPVTRNPLYKTNLVVNRSLKEAIESYLGNPSAMTPKSGEPIEIGTTTDDDFYKQTIEINSLVLDGDQNSSAGFQKQTIQLLTTINASVLENKAPLRKPRDICCVVDISGSMGGEASIQNDNGDNESQGLSLLDVVKHALRTIVGVLGKEDRLALVSFHSVAAVEMELESMDEEGKRLALQTIDELEPLECTNLWDGLKSGMDVLNKQSAGNRHSSSNRQQTLFLLTDGVPNITPPRGTEFMLSKYLDSNDCKFSVNTFGFGYNLKSYLLSNIAILGGGSYSFIPDSGFVGTVFVNTLINSLVSVSDRCTLNLEVLDQNKLKIKETSNYMLSKDMSLTSWGAKINIGSLKYDQEKDVLVELEILDSSILDLDEPLITATLQFQNDVSEKNDDFSFDFSFGSDDNNADKVKAQYFRLKVVQGIVDSIPHDDLKKSKDRQSLTTEKELLQSISDEIKESNIAKQENMIALRKDIDGQVLEALSQTKYYMKWGCHYLWSLARAHYQQECNNFKDPGVQIYTSEFREKLITVADDIFISLPPPIPSRRACSYNSNTNGGSHAPVNMGNYYNSGGSCFTGESLVLMADGTKKQCKNIVKDDVVQGGGKVVAVVEQRFKKNKQKLLVRLGSGLEITPYHPVRVNNSWEFPCKLAQVYQKECDVVYNFFLDQVHTMVINDILCCTLGHGFTGDVIAHDYFGTQRIVEDFKVKFGQQFEEGLIRLSDEIIVWNRDANNQQISSISILESR